MQIKVKWLIFWIILARCIFLASPDDVVHPFPFSMYGIPLSAYVWRNLETLMLFLIVRRWWQDTGNPAVAAFLLMVAFDGVDFLLNMNTAYMEIMGYRVTANVVMLMAYPILTWKHER